MRVSIFLILILLSISCSQSPFGCGKGDYKYTITAENNTSEDLRFTVFSAQYQSCDVVWRYKELVAPANSTTDFRLKVVGLDKDGLAEQGNVEIQFSSGGVEVKYIGANVNFFYNRYAVKKKENIHLVFDKKPCRPGENIVFTTINSSDTTIWPFYRVFTSKFTSCRPGQSPACIRYPCYGGSIAQLKVEKGGETTINATASSIDLDHWRIGAGHDNHNQSEFTILQPTPRELGFVWSSSRSLPDTIFLEFTSIEEFEVRDTR